MNVTQEIPVTDVSVAGEARRTAQRLASEIDFDETASGRVALIVTELATNLARHAKNGRILLTRIGGQGGYGIEVVAIDDGPGVDDAARWLHDGYSTGSTRGEGLGAVRRLANRFDLFSRLGTGTVIVARIESQSPERRGEPSSLANGETSVICVPYPGERLPGDSWSARATPGLNRYLVVDGLGHGLLAADAAKLAVEVFNERPELPHAALLTLMDGAMRASRGAALAMLDIASGSCSATFTGVGNISGSIVDPEGNMKSMVSMSGIVGHNMRKVQSFTYNFPRGSTLVMHSDGLSTSWRPSAYPGLTSRDPAVWAGLLYRDACRGKDDATVLVARPESRAP